MPYPGPQAVPAVVELHCGTALGTARAFLTQSDTRYVAVSPVAVSGALTASDKLPPTAASERRQLFRKARPIIGRPLKQASVLRSADP